MQSTISKEKFSHKTITAKGEDRAWVSLKSLKTLWFNTGTLCNLSCDNCYIESSPKNDRLSYISLKEVNLFLNEITEEKLPTNLIGFTGGEPFMNPEMIPILTSVLEQGFEVLVLTNAYKLLNKKKEEIEKLAQLYGYKLHIRISLDHYTAEVHEKERGSNTFEQSLLNLKWLAEKGVNVSVAGRSLIGESQEQAVSGYDRLFKGLGLNFDLNEKLVIFPEMQSGRDVPEITTACWNILNISPDNQMCATERMVIKKKGDQLPTVMPCTLLAYEKQFELGHSLKQASSDVYLNHRFCAEFCVLGGASCSSAK